MVTIVNIEHSWAERVILILLYLLSQEVSKQKLYELIYLVYKELGKLAPLEDLEFYVNMKTKQIEIIVPNKDITIEDILNNLASEEFIYIDSNNTVYNLYAGDHLVKLIMDDPKYEDEVNTIISVVAQYEDLSEQGLLNLILENLKHS